MRKKHSFAIIGGDARFTKLSEALERDGHSISAIETAENVILPLPFEWDDQIMRTLKPSQRIFAGRVRPLDIERAKAVNLHIRDYFAREELAVLNAVATVEGALEIAMRETAVTVWHSEVLVIGFGRLGKLLAHRLHAMGARVVVSARSYADKAWIAAYGYEAADSANLNTGLSAFDLIFNTVPADILGREQLAGINLNCLCIDLASKPGGIDINTASELGIRAIWALSLPGRVAPVTSSEIIKDTIYHMLDEEN
ncbi:MAG: dipicolinate synthase subunit DpsA [Oscillospiraceae bacterium]|jgi:dipicolinate synthase subunit A|nr:dipicolinate synthase subunit DpsA [Oscillospiraceae bacterium]